MFLEDFGKAIIALVTLAIVWQVVAGVFFK
jgi:hypothetical protein